MFSLVLTSRKLGFKLDLYSRFLAQKAPNESTCCLKLSSAASVSLTFPTFSDSPGQSFPPTTFLLHPEVVGVTRNVLMEMSCACGQYFLAICLICILTSQAMFLCKYCFCLATAARENSTVCLVEAALCCLFWPNPVH